MRMLSSSVGGVLRRDSLCCEVSDEAAGRSTPSASNFTREDQELAYLLTYLLTYCSCEKDGGDERQRKNGLSYTTASSLHDDVGR